MDVRPSTPGFQGGGVFGSSASAAVGRDDASLKRLYLAYRRREVSSLLALLPREAIRPLYRRARAWAIEQEVHEEKDPLATLFRYCGSLLPLPPFAIWLEDFRAHRSAYLRAVDEAPTGLTDDAPVTMDVRAFTEGGRTWYAALSVFRRDEAWRGYVGFRGEGSDVYVRTADIFRATDPVEVRDRFREFDSETLRAFLRSTLP